MELHNTNSGTFLNAQDPLWFLPKCKDKNKSVGLPSTTERIENVPRQITG
jgi:hypothetical protein